MRAIVSVSRRVVGLRVVVQERGGEKLAVEGRHVGERFVDRQPLVPLADAQAPGEVVHPQRGAVRLGQRLVENAALTEQRNQERQDLHEMRRIVQQSLALGQVLVDEEVLLLLQIPQPAVHELRRLRRGARGEVVALDQRGPQAPRRSVERHARTGDAAPDDKHVERFVGQAGLRMGAVERSPDRASDSRRSSRSTASVDRPGTAVAAGAGRARACRRRARGTPRR